MPFPGINNKVEIHLKKVMETVKNDHFENFKNFYTCRYISSQRHYCCVFLCVFHAV